MAAHESPAEDTDRSADPGAAPASLEEAVARNADACARLFEDAWGIRLDFTPGSLRVVDDVLAPFHDAAAGSGDLPQGPLVDLVADYLLEVARRRFGGAVVPGDGANPALLHVGDDRSGVVVFAREKVVGRVRNGPEDSLPFFFDGIADGLQRDGLTLLH